MGGTTGVSLEQGLGLTDISRGRPGRRPGDERSSSLDYYFIIYKINPSPLGMEQCSRVDDSPDDPGISNAWGSSDARGASGGGPSRGA
jgi:hypothetical protein